MISTGRVGAGGVRSGILRNTTGAVSARNVNLADRRNGREQFTQPARTITSKVVRNTTSSEWRSLNQQRCAQAIGKLMADDR